MTPTGIVLGTLFALRMPVAFAVVLGSLVYFFIHPEVPQQLIIQRMVAATQSFPLLAVPFFILAGTLMNRAGITDRIMRLAEVLTGHTMGGLAQVNVLNSTLMGGLSGSANADAAIDSKILVPLMVKRGYGLPFASAITIASSVITPIIPPGIGMILYGYLADVSVGRLFIGGIIPGTILCGALMLYVRIVSQRRGYGRTRERPPTLWEFWAAFREAVWALALPVLIIGGIRFGMFTPTEAGAIAVFYALFIGLLVYRQMGLRDIIPALTEAGVATGVVMLIIAAANALGWVMTWERVPQNLADWMLGLSDNKWMIVLLLNVLMLILGFFVEGTALLIIFTPIFVPIIRQLGIDPVHWGVVMVVNLTIGGITPPFGTLIYTTMSITKVRMGPLTRELLPICAVMIACLLLFTYVPAVVTFLPNLWMGAQ